MVPMSQIDVLIPYIDKPVPDLRSLVGCLSQRDPLKIIALNIDFNKMIFTKKKVFNNFIVRLAMTALNQL